MLRSFPVETCTVRSYVRLHIDVFLYNANNMFWPKIITTLPDFYICICHRESNQQPLYHPAGFSHCYQCVIWMTSLRNFVIYRGDWLTIKFCGNDSFFKNCSCFSKIPFSISVESPRIFQCLILIPAGHWVRQIDCDLHRRFFLSALLILVISITGRS